MADSAAAVSVEVCGHMEAVLSESDSSSDDSSQDNIEVEVGEVDRFSDSPVDSMHPLAVEKSGIMTADGPPTPNRNNVRWALGPEAPANVADETVMDRQPVDKAFGIVYKPCGASSKQGYELPAGPAFVDEDEFEQEMGAEFRVVLESSSGSLAGGMLESPLNSGTAQSENVSNQTVVDVDDFSDDEEYGQAKGQQKASGRGHERALHSLMERLDVFVLYFPFTHKFALLYSTYSVSGPKVTRKRCGL